MYRTAARRSWLARPLIIWLLFALSLGLVAGVSSVGDLDDVEDNGPTSQLPEGFDSTLVAEEVESFHEGTTMPAVAVFTDEDSLQEPTLSGIDSSRAALSDIPGIDEAPPAVPSEDGQAAALIVDIDMEEGGLDAFEELRETLQAAAPEGTAVHVTGPAAQLYDEVSVFDGIDERILIASVIVVVLMLLLTYRSPMLWALPLAAIGSAMGVSMGLIYLLGTYAGLTIDGQSGGILPILVFGVGTDYALLYLARYREALRITPDRYRATGQALRRAAPVILVSASTTVAGLSCLLLADLNSTRSLGAVGAIGVGTAAIAVLTLLPLLLLITGRWVFWPLIPQIGFPETPADSEAKSIWTGVADKVSVRPRRIWIGTAVALIAMCAGLASTSFGTQGAEQFRDTPESITGQEIFSEHFEAGASVPIDVITDADRQNEVLAAAAAIDGVTDANAITTDETGTRALLNVTTEHAPDSDQAAGTVHELRETLSSLPADTLVGGPTAEMVDVQEASWADMMLIAPLVLLIVALVLIVLLRAVVGPLVLLFTVAGSYVSSLGLGVLIMYLLGFEAVDIGLPLLAFVFLVSLGVDYTIFLTTRIREEVVLHGHAEGVRRGLVATGGVITGAGLVLAATFSILVAMPLVFMMGLGIVVAVGILIDTFVVRTLIVPALMLDMGPRFWSPRLGRQVGTASPTPAGADE